MKSQHPAADYLRAYVPLMLRAEALEDALQYFQQLPYQDDLFNLRMRDRVQAIRDQAKERLRLLDLMQDTTESRVLRMRYIEDESWVKISLAIHYGETRTYEIHQKALDNFWNICQKEGQNASNHEPRSA